MIEQLVIDPEDVTREMNALERREAERLASLATRERSQNAHPGQWKPRAVMLARLDAVGGALEPAEGKKFIPGERIRRVLGVATTTLQIAERDGVIRRVMNSRRTLGIYLTDEGRALLAKFDTRELDAAVRKAGGLNPMKVKTNGKHAPESPKRGRPRKPVTVVPHPPLGELTRVAGVDVDRDGVMRLRLETEHGSWLVAIEGYTQL